MVIYKPREFAKLAGVSVTTLQRWDRDGILVADRSITNRRVYTDEHLSKIRINRLGKAAQRDSSSQGDCILGSQPVIVKRVGRGRPGIDLTGRDFGELHVIGRDADFVYLNGRHDVMWKCQCSCGNIASVRTSNFTSGGTISCGCMRSGRRYGSKTDEARHVSDKVLARTEAMVGHYYGRWFVESVAYETCNGSDTKIRLNCVCKCGTRRKVLRSSLSDGSSVSCGCYRADVMREQARFEDLTGRTFGSWTVESRGET